MFDLWRLKKRLLSVFLTTVISILLINYSSLVAVSSSNQEIRGIWLTSHDVDILLDRQKLDNGIVELSKANFNTLYPVVWNSGYAFYDSQITQRMGIQPFKHIGYQGQDPVKELIKKAHRKGLLVIPWFEFGFMAPPSSELALKYPHWLTQKRDGTNTTISAAGEVVWLNPFRPEVQNFITSLVMEVMDNYDVDGIQFDDHLSLPSELGYDAYTISLYEQETQNKPPANHQDADWLKWRADKLTAYVTQLNQAVKAKKSNAIFSLSPNPYHTAYNRFLQDWITWVRQDLVDELIVQVYRDNLNNFSRELRQPEIQETQKKIPTAVGILTGLKQRPIAIKFIQQKVLAAKQQNYGVSFFFYGSLWNNITESSEIRQKKIFKFFPYSSKRVAS